MYLITYELNFAFGFFELTAMSGHIVGLLF